MSLTIPSPSVVQAIRESVTGRLFSRVHFDEMLKICGVRVCATCDGLARVDNPMVPTEFNKFVHRLRRSEAEKHRLHSHFKKGMVDACTCTDKRLSAFCLSPETRVFVDETDVEMVDICRMCSEEWDKAQMKGKQSRMQCPRLALWNGSLTGETPEMFRDHTPAEIALLSPNRILTNAIVLKCDHHQGIYGWHSMFENDVKMNVSNVQFMINEGLKGEFLCVLCGPWTRVGHDKAKKSHSVNPEKVVASFAWLKENNVHFKDIVIPEKDQLPIPKIMEHRD